MASIVNFGFTLLKGVVSVGEVTNLEPPKLSTGKIERTHHGSPNAHEFISDKLVLMDEFKATVSVNGSAMSAFIADLKDGSIDLYTITFPGDVDPWAFKAFVREISQQKADAQNPDLLMVDVVFVPTPDIDLGNTTFYG